MDYERLIGTEMNPAEVIRIIGRLINKLEMSALDFEEYRVEDINIDLINKEEHNKITISLENIIRTYDEGKEEPIFKCEYNSMGSL